MMATPVQAFKASDGSIHSTREAADNRDKRISQREKESRLFPIIEKYLGNHHFTALSKSIAPFNSEKWHDYQQERDEFCQELAAMIIAEIDEINELVG